MSPHDSIITVKNLSKTFIVPTEKRNTLKDTLFNLHRRNPKRVFKALSDINFSVKRGEFFGIIGRNGSGKSTLLKILAKIYRADHEHTLTIDGTISPFLELGVGFNPEMTARENVYLNAAILGLPKKLIDECFQSIIAFAELEDFVEQKLKFFSSGMQVRLAFAVAIQADADILLLDEVLAVGDANFQRKCFDIFRLFKKQGKTIIFVSHDLGAVRQFCNRALYLKDSVVEMIGDPNAVVDHYLYTDRKSNQGAEQDLERGGLVTDISSVIFIDKFGHNNQTFMSGDNIEIQIEVTSSREIVEPNLGIAIYDDKENHIFGSNAEIIGVRLPTIKVGKSLFTLYLKNLPLLQGKYFLTITIANMECTENYVWKDKKYIFYINSSTRSSGVVEIPFEIKVT